MKTLKKSNKMDFNNLIRKYFPHKVLTNERVFIENPRSFKKDGTISVNYNPINEFFLKRKFIKEINSFSGEIELKLNFEEDDEEDDINFAFPVEFSMPLSFSLNLYFSAKSIVAMAYPSEYFNIKIPLKLIK
jgi:hypothetical protein